MKSIERKFAKIQAQYPKSSTLHNFNSTIKGENLSERIILHWFNILVEREDYEYLPSLKKELLKYAYELGKTSVDGMK